MISKVVHKTLAEEAKAQYILGNTAMYPSTVHFEIGALYK